MAIKICPKVYQVGGADLSHADDCCVYLVESKQGCALIDTGAGRGTRRIIDNINKLGFESDQISYIILTHGHIDHIGGAKELQVQTGAQVVAHELELDAIENGNPQLTAASWYGLEYEPIQVNRVVSQDGESITLGDIELVLLHTPGHTPGSISVLCTYGDCRILFGQDIHGPFNHEWGSDLKLWRSSMQRLMKLEADILCEGHFGIYQPAARVRQYIETYLRRY